MVVNFDFHRRVAAYLKGACGRFGGSLRSGKVPDLGSVIQNPLNRVFLMLHCSLLITH